MYKVASNRRMTTLHRGRPADWVNGDERLSAQEQLKQMKEGVRILEARIIALPKGASGRKQLGLDKLALQNDIKAFKAKHEGLLAKPRERVGYEEMFVHIAREILPKVQFELVRNATLREYDRQEKQSLTSGQVSAAPAANIQKDPT